jgi:hypothetical protein
MRQIERPFKILGTAFAIAAAGVWSLKYADANQDGRITVGEMQDYLSDKVARQATTLGRKQNTQFVGDANRVLVGR